MKDDSLRTPPQLDRWQVYFDEVPEAALNANRRFYFHNDPLNEGDTLRLQVAVENIGFLPMDSLTVDFYLYDNNHVRRNLKTVKLDSLRANQYLLADVSVDSTFGMAGQNSLWIFAAASSSVRNRSCSIRCANSLERMMATAARSAKLSKMARSSLSKEGLSFELRALRTPKSSSR